MLLGLLRYQVVELRLNFRLVAAKRQWPEKAWGQIGTGFQVLALSY